MTRRVRYVSPEDEELVRRNPRLEEISQRLVSIDFDHEPLRAEL